MGKRHETEPSDAFKEIDDEKLYTPIEDLQKITAGGVYKRNSFKLNSLPKGIRYIGYFIIAFSILTFLIAIIMNLIF